MRRRLQWHRLEAGEFFRASLATSYYGVRSETPHQHRQNLPLLRGRQGGRRRGRLERLR